MHALKDTSKYTNVKLHTFRSMYASKYSYFEYLKLCTFCVLVSILRSVPTKYASFKERRSMHMLNFVCTVQVFVLQSVHTLLYAYSHGQFWFCETPPGVCPSTCCPRRRCAATHQTASSRAGSPTPAARVDHIQAVVETCSSSSRF